MIFVFCACSHKDEDDYYDDILADLQEELDGREKAAERYVIIIPSSSSSELYEAAEKLAYKIGENTETETDLFYDHEDADIGKEDREILIGDTSRGESQSFFRGYRAEDFGYGYSGEAIVVGGLCERATLSAIDKFTKDVVNYADIELFMSADTSYFYRGEYSIEKITLNGFELCDYTLLYDKSVSASCDIALSFRDSLSERAGYYLRIKECSEVSDSTRAIYIGESNNFLRLSISVGDNEAGIFSYPTGIAIAAENTFGYQLAAERLLGALCATDKSGSSDILISEAMKFTFISSELSVLSVYPFESQLSIAQVNSVAESIRAYSADFISVYGISETSSNGICQAAGADYIKVRVAGDEDSGVYHMYPSTLLSEPCVETLSLTEGELVTARYRIKPTDTEISVMEVIPNDRADISSAIAMAARINALAEAESGKTLIIKSNFEANVDAVFGVSIECAERLNLYDTSKNLPTLAMYLSRHDCSVSDCVEEKNNIAEYEYASLKIYD